MFWAKAPLATDATYRAGIPLPGFDHITLDPWQPPAAKTSLLPAILLSDRLGLDEDGFLQLEFDLPAPTATALPPLGELTAANRIVTENADLLGWTRTVAPATGLFTGKLTFRDPVGTRTVARAVTINGILRQPPTPSSTPVKRSSALPSSASPASAPRPPRPPAAPSASTPRPSANNPARATPLIPAADCF